MKIAVAVLLTLAVAHGLRAEDDTLTAFGPGITNLAGGLTIGDSGTNNRLRIVSGGIVTNGGGTIGNLATASGNSALVTGEGSQWACTESLFVGLAGAANAMVVSNGAQVFTGHESGFAEIGEGEIGSASTSTGNTVLVTGTNSDWTCMNDFYLGRAGAGNRLELADGGRLTVGIAYGTGVSRVGAQAGSDGNLATIAGPGTVWESRRLYLGLAGSGNGVTVSNGANLKGTVSIGGDSAARSNVLTVTGSGTVLNPASTVTVGDYGTANSMVVADGARVEIGSGHLGYDAAASNNSMLVTGSGTVWICNSQFVAGYGGCGNTLTVSNGARLSTQFSFVMGFSGGTATDNLVRVVGPGSTISNAASVLVGYASPDNALIIEDGARVQDRIGRLGDLTAAANDRATVTGAGSSWDSTEELEIGRYASGNALVISNGARASDRNGMIGATDRSSNNTAVVTGAGTVWSNRYALNVGPYSPGNGLRILDGAVASGSDGMIGMGDNAALVADPGSLWTNSGAVEVAGALVVSNGATVADATGWIDGHGSSAVVTGPGSAWLHTSALRLAQQSNSLAVIGGALVWAPEMTISADAGDESNHVTVNGGRLVVTNAGGTATLAVGGDGSGTLAIVSGSVTADRLVATNPASAFVMLDGLAVVREASLGFAIAIGDGAAPAELRLDGGTGVVTEAMTVRTGARLSATNGAALRFLGPVTNNGVIDATFGTAEFAVAPAGTGVVLRANGDADADGATDLGEALAGTDPMNGASYLHVTSVNASPDGVRIGWMAGGGRTNIVEAAPEMTGSFTNLGPAVVLPGSGDVWTNVTDAGATTNSCTRYYRIRLGP